MQLTFLKAAVSMNAAPEIIDLLLEKGCLKDSYTIFINQALKLGHKKLARYLFQCFLKKHFVLSFDTYLLSLKVEEFEYADHFLKNYADDFLKNYKQPILSNLRDLIMSAAIKVGKASLVREALLLLQDDPKKLSEGLSQAIVEQKPELAKIFLEKGASATLYGWRAHALLKHLDVEYQVSDEEKSLSDEIEFIKILSNGWSLRGKFDLSGVKDEYDGGTAAIGQHIVNTYLGRFIEERESGERELLLQVKQIVESSLVTEGTNEEEILEKYRNGDTLIFQTGIRLHIIQVIFIDDSY